MSIFSSPRSQPAKLTLCTPILQNTDISYTNIPYTTLKSEISLLKTRITQLTSEKAALAASLDTAEARARKADAAVAALEQKISNIRIKQKISCEKPNFSSPVPSESEGTSIWAEKIAAVRSASLAHEHKLKKHVELLEQELLDAKKTHGEEISRLNQQHDREVFLLKREISQQVKSDHVKKLKNKISRLHEALEALFFDLALQNKTAHEIFAEAEISIASERWAEAEKKLRIVENMMDTEIYGKKFVADVHGSLGVACHAQGRLEEAEISYRQAVAVDVKAHACWANLATLLGRLGRQGEAETAIDTALKILKEAGLDIPQSYEKIQIEILSAI